LFLAKFASRCRNGRLSNGLDLATIYFARGPTIQLVQGLIYMYIHIAVASPRSYWLFLSLSFLCSYLSLSLSRLSPALSLSPVSLQLSLSLSSVLSALSSSLSYVRLELAATLVYLSFGNLSILSCAGHKTANFANWALLSFPMLCCSSALRSSTRTILCTIPRSILCTIPRTISSPGFHL
jgi:hypothetical protein